MSQKLRTQKAIERYIQKQTPSTKPRRKNGSPEKEVERKVLEWCKQNSWSLDVVDAKATYSMSANRFLRGPTRSGFSDLVGSTDQGLSVYLELKSPGKISAVREKQFLFLREKIEKNCFAAVIDSVSLLEQIYREFRLSKNPRELLLSYLPIPKEMRDDKAALFD